MCPRAVSVKDRVLLVRWGDIPLSYRRILEPFVARRGLIIGFGLAFELPVILTLLIRAETVEVASLVRLRRYAHLGITVIAAFLTRRRAGGEADVANRVSRPSASSLFGQRFVERRVEAGFQTRRIVERPFQ